MSALSSTDYVFQAVAGIEGLAICILNSVLLLTILPEKTRRKEMIIITGLALADLTFGIGNLTLAVYRIALMASNQYLKTTTAWKCIVLPPVFLSDIGIQLVAVMFLFVCIDRYIATKHRSSYVTMGTGYAVTVVGLVFLYGLISLATMLLSVHFNEPDPEQSANNNNTVSVMCTATLWPRWYGLFHYTVSTAAGLFGVLLYIRIYRAYEKKKVQAVTPKSTQEPDKQSHLTATLGYISIIIFLMFIVPITIMTVYNWQNNPIPQTLATILGLLTRISATIYIRIYIRRHADIKSGMARVIKCKCQKSPQFVDKPAGNVHDVVTLF